MNHKRIVRSLLAWFAANARDLPWRWTRDPYAIWVSEIMLQQTQVKTVIPYWERWMRQMPTARVLAKAKPSKLHKLWEGLGYYTRVRNMQKAARAIVGDHGGRFPQEFEKVLELPGIGRYTAGAICSIAFNQPYPVLDGNVIRVLTRVFGIGGSPRESRTNAKLWQLAEDLVRIAGAVDVTLAPIKRASPRKTSGVSTKGKGLNLTRFAASGFNQALMELGALVCTARQPRCPVCPIARFCVARNEDRIHDLPALSSRGPYTNRRFAAFVLETKGRFLARQRPQGVVNAFFWEFPNVELIPKDFDVHEAAEKQFGDLPTLEPFCSIKHTITRFRITLDVFRARLQNRTLPPTLDGARWLTQAALERLPFTSAHKKVLLKLRENQPRPV